MLVRVWCNRNSYLLLVGMQNGTATGEDTLVVPICFSNHTPWWRDAHTKTCAWTFKAALSTIAKISEVGTWAAAQLHNRMLLSNKKKWAIKPWGPVEETDVGIAKCKKTIWGGYLASESNSLSFWKRQIYGDSKKIRGGGVGKERPISRVPHDAVMTDTHQYTLVKTHTLRNTKDEH